MHLLTTYALSCGAKIDKPFIYEAFCPLPDAPFVTFHTNTKFGSKNYDYWQDVIDLIHPILQENGIKIAQTGLPNDPLINKSIDYRGKTSPNQLAYLIKSSKLHFGSDSFAVHLSSIYDIPIVALYNIIQPENAGPYFGDKSKQILFKCYERANQKPSYAAEENPKTINLINPEEIAAAILQLLKIDYKPQYKTVHIGERYGKIKINDFVPNQIANASDKNVVIDFRMDYLFNENALAAQLQLNKCRIFTDKRINLEILKNFKNSIDSVYYFVHENHDPKFVSDVSNLGIKTVLLSLDSPEKVQEKKINYYELGNINLIPPPNHEVVQKLKNVKNLYYKSCRSVHSNRKIYPCLAAERLNQERNDGFQPVIDNPLFWHDMEDFFFVEMLDNTQKV